MRHRERGRLTAVAAAATALSVLSACGSDAGPTRTSSPSAAPARTLTVLAASSLSKVFPQIGDAFAAVDPGVTLEFEFAGTDALTAQIEQGAPADVFAGASKKYGDQLSGEGLISPTRPFATNRLVLILPANDPGGIASLQDLTRAGIKLVIGADTVPIGTYTRTVLMNLDALYGAGYSDEVLANVVSNEDSVSTVVSKVQLGEADAGFVYVTDALAAGAAVRTIELPAEAQAVATYPIAAVKRSKEAADAQRFADFVLSPQAQALLKQAGFGPPPAG
jgi:molybdate transport system substrate-binding protein